MMETERSYPPPVPSSSVYTACYCEENVYLLGKSFQSVLPASARIFAVVISNEQRTVAIWEQKPSRLGEDNDHLVVWDYHVILCLATDDYSSVWVYDFDSRLDMPCQWDRYIRHTFKSDHIVSGDQVFDVPWDSRFRCMFRVIPLQDYLDHFASDRRHMIRNYVAVQEDPSILEEYQSPPPSYAPLAGKVALSRGVMDNLMTSFVDMVARDVGLVLDDVTFLRDTSWMSIAVPVHSGGGDSRRMTQ